MSHWVKYENEVFENTDMRILSKAVRNLGYKLDTKCKHIQNSWGESAADAAITSDNRQLNLGFKKNNITNILELVGDFFGSGIDEETFLDKIAQQYQSERIQEVLLNNNWNIENIQTNSNNEIVINAFEYNI